MTLASAHAPLTPLLDGQGNVTFTWLKFFQALQQSSTQTLPDIGGQITVGQLPAVGVSVTIATAKLTGGGANGSMTFTNGLLTAQVQAT